MCLSLHDYQSKASRYSYGLTYLITRVTTNQTHIIDSQKSVRKELKYNTKKKSSNHKRKNKKKKGTEKKYKFNWKTRFKIVINTYISVITLNVNGLNDPIKRQTVADWIII